MSSPFLSTTPDTGDVHRRQPGRTPLEDVEHLFRRVTTSAPVHPLLRLICLYRGVLASDIDRITEKAGDV